MFQQEARIHFGKADSIENLSSQPNIWFSLADSGTPPVHLINQRDVRDQLKILRLRSQPYQRSQRYSRLSERLIRASSTHARVPGVQ
jgi:hypothetical protein